MWCGNAIGELLPPMIVYKAKNSYEVLEEGGPVGTTCAATKSGWFHSETFATWFTECFLPRANKQVGPKILLGDNLASHFNPHVVELAAQHDIYFVMLPPNATHIMQPLDVAVFASMKRVGGRYWMTIRKKLADLGHFRRLSLQHFLHVFGIVKHTL